MPTLAGATHRNHFRKLVPSPLPDTSHYHCSGSHVISTPYPFPEAPSYYDNPKARDAKTIRRCAPLTREERRTDIPACHFFVPACHFLPKNCNSDTQNHPQNAIPSTSVAETSKKLTHRHIQNRIGLIIALSHSDLILFV